MNTPEAEIIPPGQGPTEVQLAVMPRADGIVRFRPLSAQLDIAFENTACLTISADMTPEDQERVAKEARRARLDLIAPVRRDAGTIHKELKSGILEIGRKLDEAEREIRRKCEAEEERLKQIEQFPEEERERKRIALNTARRAALEPYVTTPIGDLSAMTQEDFDKVLADARELYEVREEKRIRAEKEAAEAEERRKKEEEERRIKEAEERARLEKEAAEQRAELERLKKEATEKERQRKKELERMRREQEAREAAARKEREESEERSRQQLKELEERTRKEREAAEAARERQAAIDAEKARVERERIAKEKEAAEAALAEERRRREAAEAEERRKKAEAAAEERRRAAAPDIEKIMAYRAAVIDIRIPELSDEKAKGAVLAARVAFVRSLQAIADAKGGAA